MLTLQETRLIQTLFPTTCCTTSVSFKGRIRSSGWAETPSGFFHRGVSWTLTAAHRDYATFDAAQKQALIGSIDPSRSKDYPTTISIGPSFFDSYSTWPNTTFVHGFNLGKNGSVGHDTLVATVPLACKALSSGNLAYWQLGNEPDLYKTSAQGPVRPAWWNETDYVVEWLNKTRLTKQLVHESCPELISEGNFQFYAPSFGGTANSLNLVTTWAAGLDADGDVGCIDSHK